MPPGVGYSGSPTQLPGEFDLMLALTLSARCKAGLLLLFLAFSACLSTYSSSQKSDSQLMELPAIPW